MNGTECRPQAPVAEWGSEIVRVADRGATGGTDGTGSPGSGGLRAASGRLKSDIKLINAFVLVRQDFLERGDRAVDVLVVDVLVRDHADPAGQGQSQDSLVLHSL